MQAIIKNIIKYYVITHGNIALDDSDKNAACIKGAHKVKNKAMGGYFNGQERVFMVLFTEWITFLIGFRF
ncbi:hypothetical protein CXF72_01200 [Psychromonas sp. MB-3u-54]|uniref:hypothetical protein n=1 Tax=Psychromonas sp. MB-3u-54 TaxID=2058319 RepID=UPI000C320271|nr:hypothetical protein [Psychromonas sp. MB-3u-54]PKH04388.1 hypothetical protein CXF72_01200 [Psychromonas sp. MB-3u-54]